MRKFSEGTKMWISVMAAFLIYAVVFILFDDYDRKMLEPLNQVNDWHLMVFAVVVMVILGFVLLRYCKRMDERIEQEQEMKQTLMRRQLTQNIAHEIKTPVASILGYTETLLSTPDIPHETAKRFLERTHVQAQRLTSLLADLSILNRVDYAPHVIAMHRVNVSQLVGDVVQDVELALKKKGMKLNNYLPEDIIVNGNESLIYSIFSNLIDNSINYAGEGSTIEILASDTIQHWNFIYRDNGMGVEEQHLSRLFERFYRVDKGRSRSMGGTGLGLAIVKNAVLQHNGTITVEKLDEGGLQFKFSLKK
ncbi:MAG: hypothetical protein IIU17_04965 [Muribaculaceae bacterium]|nr:hypothetical protein [Muribaculaceae bacterium]